MAKRKKKSAICPCCRCTKRRTEMKICISILERIEKKEYTHYPELGIDAYASFIASDFEWACDECIASKRAIPANPALQSYSWNPHIAYCDSTFLCNNCGTAFTFSKEEKQFWYETLTFWVDSRPNTCVNCRKEIRQYKLENKTLSAMGKKKESEMSVEEVEAILVIYRKWGKDNKVNYYESILKKRKRSE